MNISGVTQTAQILPGSQSPAAPQQIQTAEQEEALMGAETLMGADAVNFGAQVQTQVMDIAQSQFEDAANQLISTMAAATGIGQTVDVSV